MIASLDLYVAATIFIVLDFMSHNFPKKSGTFLWLHFLKIDSAQIFLLADWP